MSSLLLRTTWGLGPLLSALALPPAALLYRYLARPGRRVRRAEEIEDGDDVADGVHDEHQLTHVT